MDRPGARLLTANGLWVLASLNAAYLVSLPFYAALRLSVRRRIVTGLLLAPLVALTPLLVPASAPDASPAWTITGPRR